MKKLLLVAAAVAALMVSAKPAAAQAPAQAGQAGCAECNDPGAGGYGYGGFMGKGKSGWLSGKLHGLFSNHHGNPPQMLPTGTGGQLVFPQNPFIRGPRDYFMWDER
ncbi:MAG TPA: hypothetical protein VHR66_23575 [Gemmataceae bacterium]|jgi:opacity protein-like surface antigen|nr:hypothetical protein [Gemmataceae bacterium]